MSEVLVFEAATKGKKYSIKVYKDGDKYNSREFTKGNEVGRKIGYDKEQITKSISDVIKYSSQIDGINYIISINELNPRITLVK